MKTITKGLSAVAMVLAAAGIAHAAQDQRGWGGPDANATVTRADAQAKAEAMFAKHDANGDGRIDQADRAAMMGKKFDAMDTDRNGALSRAEFMAGHQNHGDHAGMAMGDEGGKMGRHGGRHGRGGGMMMKMADTNKDGAVTRDEAVAGALKHFDMTDTNRDGKVTPEERKAAMAKMRSHMKGMRGQMGDDMPPPPAG
ncbi:EF-hand domain-containing protein [Novosphingobium aquiterrae]|uniref:EF-hand domain-containing protein n=1 Tax=Novosphingobium aquiterrae TaxID=624388 RepID=A0ABV6PJS0_9SPHN